MIYTGSCVAAVDCNTTSDCDTSCQSQSTFNTISSDIGALGKQSDRMEWRKGSGLMIDTDNYQFVIELEYADTYKELIVLVLSEYS